MKIEQLAAKPNISRSTPFELLLAGKLPGKGSASGGRGISKSLTGGWVNRRSKKTGSRCMAHLEHIKVNEKRLWSAADTLRANSSHASNEYFLPVIRLVFLRRVYSRYLAARVGIATSLPTRSSAGQMLFLADMQSGRPAASRTGSN